jgi:hypothetical protein
MPEPTSEPKPYLPITARSLLAGPDMALVLAIDIDLRPEKIGDFC